jgi:hypothetical protein
MHTPLVPSVLKLGQGKQCVLGAIITKCVIQQIGGWIEIHN